MEIRVLGPFEATPETGTGTEEVLELAERAGDPVLSSRARILRYRAAMELGDAAEAERCLAANEAMIGQLNQPALAWQVRLQRAGHRLLRGDVDGADAEWEAVCRFGQEIGQPGAGTYHWAGALLIRFEQGRTAELEDATRDILRGTPLALVGAFLAVIHDEAHDPERAEQAFRPLAAQGFAVPFDFVWLRYQCDAAMVCSHLGDRASAAVLQAHLQPYADRFPTLVFGSLVTGSVHHYLGMLAGTLGQYGEADARFSAAAAAHERIGAPAWLARTYLEWARVLSLRGDAPQGQRAHELVEQSRRIGRQLGLKSLLRHARSG